MSSSGEMIVKLELVTPKKTAEAFYTRTFGAAGGGDLENLGAGLRDCDCA